MCVRAAIPGKNIACSEAQHIKMLGEMKLGSLGN